MITSQPTWQKTHWNGDTWARNDFFSPSNPTSDRLAGWEILIHHWRLSWFLLIAISGILTATPELVIDALGDVRHFFRHWLAFDYWLLLKLNLCCLWCWSSSVWTLILSLRADWGKDSRVPNLHMCEELQNLKWLQQNNEHCVKLPRPLLPQFDTTAAAQLVFKLTASVWGWRTVGAETWGHNRAQGQ